MQIFVDTKYDFLKWRWRATALFLAFIAVGIGLLFVNGLNLGIDFSGGASIILRFTDKVPVDELRSTLSDATIQQYGKPEENSILIRLPEQGREGDYAGAIVLDLHKKMNPDAGTKLDLNFHGSDRLRALLVQNDPDKRGTNPAAIDYYRDLVARVIERRTELGLFRSMQEVVSTPGVTTATATLLNAQTFPGRFNLLSQETVGPAVGSQLQKQAILAIVLATLAMGLYIAIRFDLTFGVAAIIALVVDTAFAFAFLVMAQLEFSLITVAAFLMIIGYSINDKVVIYDRVRENMKKGRNQDFETVLNHSLNQTLSRTILTGGCVLLILLSLIFFGGEVIHDFALLLFIGTVVGTITTLTVVPAFVIAWRRSRASAAPERVEAPRVEAPRKRRAS
ncbi:MAG TPA: protein translocase subunit SecF [Thermoanaerobaculia bacterium]|jgi:preprotein translocase SecF subunit|nr:protein translocase subunit SecF [Thermoanaerobaculia bacterium]